MPRQKAAKAQVSVPTKPCLGWCGKLIPYHCAAERYCSKCRAIKDSRFRSMSRMEAMTLQTSGVSVNTPSDFGD